MADENVIKRAATTLQGLWAEVERLQAENRELRERLAAGFASTVVIDVSHDDAARKLRHVMRALEKITGPDGGMQ